MDEQEIVTVLIIASAVITAVWIGCGVWFVSHLTKTLDIAKAGMEAAESIATSVEKFDALLNKQRTEGRK